MTPPDQKPEEKEKPPAPSWGDPGIGNIISGIKAELVKVGGDEVVVHVTFPPGTPKERSSSFAKRLREQFPSSVRMVFTTPGVQINISRPKTVNLSISDCSIAISDLKDRISQVLTEEADTINIRLHNVSIEKERKNGKPLVPVRNNRSKEC